MTFLGHHSPISHRLTIFLNYIRCFLFVSFITQSLEQKPFSFRRCRKFYHWHEKLSWKFTVQMLFVKHTKKPSLIRNCRKIFRLRLSSLKISAILLNHKIHAISWMWLHALFPSPPLSSFVLQLFCFVPFVCNVWLCLNVVHIIRKKNRRWNCSVWIKNGFSATHWIINRFIASSVNIYRKSITIFREYLITFICAEFINLIENCRYTKLFILPRRSSI